MITLVDEFGYGLVPLWSINHLTKKVLVQAGTKVEKLGRQANGYWLVEFSGSIYEVWQPEWN